MATCIGCGQACVCAPIEPCNCGSQCGRISWSLDLERSRVVLSKCTNWDDVATRGEVRADVRVLADQLKRPITIIDPTDPIPGRVAEVVEPTRSLVPDMHPGLRASIESVTGRELPALEVDDDEPGITRDRVMR